MPWQWSDVFSAATSAEELHQCRAANQTYDFSNIRCRCDQVIHIRSAVVGFSKKWYTDGKLWRCPLTEATCTRTITNHPAITKCHGKSTCWIPRDILYYTPYDRLCDAHQHGNAISIKYDCIDPGKRKYCLMDLCFKYLSIFHKQAACGVVDEDLINCCWAILPPGL